MAEDLPWISTCVLARCRGGGDVNGRGEGLGNRDPRMLHSRPGEHGEAGLLVDDLEAENGLVDATDLRLVFGVENQKERGGEV